jgi:hypothetical protein
MAATTRIYKVQSILQWENSKKTVGRCNKKLFSDELDFMEPSSNQELNLPEVFEYHGRVDDLNDHSDLPSTEDLKINDQKKYS